MLFASSLKGFYNIPVLLHSLFNIIEFKIIIKNIRYKLDLNEN